MGVETSLKLHLFVYTIQSLPLVGRVDLAAVFLDVHKLKQENLFFSKSFCMWVAAFLYTCYAHFSDNLFRQYARLCTIMAVVVLLCVCVVAYLFESSHFHTIIHLTVTHYLNPSLRRQFLRREQVQLQGLSGRVPD